MRPSSISVPSSDGSFPPVAPGPIFGLFSNSARVLGRCPPHNHGEVAHVGHLHIIDPTSLSSGSLSVFTLHGSEPVLDSVVALIPMAEQSFLAQMGLLIAMQGLNLGAAPGPQADDARPDQSDLSDDEHEEDTPTPGPR